jgi:hypothetical protein
MFDRHTKIVLSAVLLTITVIAASAINIHDDTPCTLLMIAPSTLQRSIELSCAPLLTTMLSPPYLEAMTMTRMMRMASLTHLLN